MSRQMVGAVIHCLLTDEQLRIRFASDPIEALADLELRGFELTQQEADVFITTDPRMWSWDRLLIGCRVH